MTVGMVVLASFQRNVGLILAPVVIIGFVIYLLVNIRKARPELGNELELAPNRKPYYDDEQLEGRRLDRYLTMALVLIGVSAVGLPLYWLAEPGRQSGQIERFEEIFASRGEGLFEANCASCHAAGGVGGVAAYVLNDKDGRFVEDVSWVAPALNNALLRFSRDEIEYVLDHGRAFSPMQPWSTVGGGAMNAQQIKNLVDYLASISISPDEAAAEVETGIVGRVVDERAAAIDAANPQLPGEPAQAFTDRITALKADDEELVTDTFENAGTELDALVALGVSPDANAARLKLGELLFNNEGSSGSYSCARCHTPGFSYGRPGITGAGAFGPRIIGADAKFESSAQFADFLADGCEIGEVYGVVAPDGAQAQCKSGQMPAFGAYLSPEQLEAVVAYVSSLDGTQQYDKALGEDEAE